MDLAGSFEEVSGISMEVPRDEIASGGKNRDQYQLPSAPKYQNLVVKRGVLSTDSLLAKCCSSTFKNDFSNPILPQNLVLHLLDSNGLSLKQWSFCNAYPVAYSISDFKSHDGAITVESIEFAYASFDVFEGSL